ncbi:MAG: site-specific tyrosine recombinase XerD [Clostridiaceae bacterium]|uniref:Tyrosine recombinase XerC n=1 Tax=Clostridium porci TaxID=2605778 RepID=A0A7X2TCG7_9CLOT|nr:MULTISPECIES: site-specific tyrosine recombinase XerD [Clostridium]MCI6140363.1 site-specific tyrosine recombinase XerD [Clostridium sp.]MDU3396859.1 site-specific tyrosine recombinase XerD [Clostridiales bacterium]MDY3230211.1 site-specific tyrosine recombinase XerD [Clostridiaceae bacterium]MSS36113.1 site-specific tyrosine recombinase XerD [Clostridium porci]
MTSEIKNFVNYLRDVKKTSRNTEVSYQRDLTQLAAFLEEKGITEVGKITRTSLNSYILFLEKEGKATTTISRELASIKAFFHFLFREGRIRRDPAEFLKAPKIEKKAPVILTVNEVNALLEQPMNGSPKEIRDKAMLELLYATGIRVSELIGLSMNDLNLQVGYITCRDGQKERMVPFGRNAKQAMVRYLDQGREALLKGKESEWLFTNCNGRAMSRQGFWKIIKCYGAKAGIEADITPHTLRHSFAAHLLRGGADIHAVQAMLGHSDAATTQMYAAYSDSTVREAYRDAFMRKKA